MGNLHEHTCKRGKLCYKPSVRRQLSTDENPESTGGLSDPGLLIEASLYFCTFMNTKLSVGGKNVNLCLRETYC